MAVLLRLLPLLVVGCLLLQSLQPTAVSGQEVCDQTIEDEAVTFEDYATIFSNGPTLTPRVCQNLTKVVASCIFNLLQERQNANERLTEHYKSCTKEDLRQHLPFEYDDSMSESASNIKTLCQDGYIIRYSTKRRTPLFTAQRFNGLDYKAARLSVRN